MRPTVGSPDSHAGAASAPAQPRATIEELRRTLARMSSAERRLRSREHPNPGELTHAQIRSIAALGREPEMTVGQLARSAELKPATVTVMLDHLEEAGMVQRHRSTEDRRVCNVSLTPKGWEVLERKLEAWQSLWEERLSGISDADLQTSIRVIEQVAGLYDAVAPRRKPRRATSGSQADLQGSQVAPSRSRRSAALRTE